MESANSTSLRTGVGAQPFISRIGWSGRKSAAVRYLRFTIRQPPLHPARIGSWSPVSRRSPTVMAMSSRITASWFAWSHPAAHMLGRLLMFPGNGSHTLAPSLTPTTLCCCLCSRALYLLRAARQVLWLPRLAMSTSHGSRAGEGILAFSRRTAHGISLCRIVKLYNCSNLNA